MIKVDIINEVCKAADITKVKAEVAVEAVLEAMKDSMMKGERIELRGFGVFQVKPRKRGIGRNPRTGKEVKIPPGPHHPLQARQGPPEPQPVARLAGAPYHVSLPRTRRASAAAACPLVDAGLPAPSPRSPLDGRVAGTSPLFLAHHRLRASGRAHRRLGLRWRAVRLVVAVIADHPARPRDGPLPRVPPLRRRRHACPSSSRSPSAAWSARSAPSSASAARSPTAAPCSTSASPGRWPGSSSACPCSRSGVLEAQRRARETVEPGARALGEPLLFQWADGAAARRRRPRARRS